MNLFPGYDRVRLNCPWRCFRLSSKGDRYHHLVCPRWHRPLHFTLGGSCVKPVLLWTSPHPSDKKQTNQPWVLQMHPEMTFFFFFFLLLEISVRVHLRLPTSQSTTPQHLWNSCARRKKGFLLWKLIWPSGNRNTWRRVWWDSLLWMQLQLWLLRGKWDFS